MPSHAFVRRPSKPVSRRTAAPLALSLLLAACHSTELPGDQPVHVPDGSTAPASSPRKIEKAAPPLRACDDLVVPPPKTLDPLDLELPRTVKSYCKFETGFQHSMVQVRFELDPVDLPVLESRLPCRLEKVSSGPVAHALVGTNDRRWYAPESARRHRGCDYDSGGLLSASFLVDVSVSSRAVVYAVVMVE
ncbi:MAG: hypothetical protein KF819_32710 [Labilithrix sp.]|nr:hypothetical protein [Labilithrix sp.]